MMLTAKGFRRSRALVSVKLMKSDWTTGHAVKARKSRQNGTARIQAARPSRRRAESVRRREGAAPVWADWAVIGSHSRADGVGLLLRGLERLGRVLTRLGDLLHLGVEGLHGLLPGRAGRWRWCTTWPGPSGRPATGRTSRRCRGSSCS